MAKRVINEGVIIDGEYTLRTWIELYKAGKFNSPSTHIMIDAGWYDWFCKSESLFTRLQKLAPKVMAVANSAKIDLDNTYVFFKNNCPCVGSTYDDFRICDIHTGNVLYTIGCVNAGTWGEKKGGWFVYDFNGGGGEVFTKGSWRDVKKYFGI